jgi:hypothetical protein
MCPLICSLKVGVSLRQRYHDNSQTAAISVEPYHLFLPSSILDHPVDQQVREYNGPGKRYRDSTHIVTNPNDTPCLQTVGAMRASWMH